MNVAVLMLVGASVGLFLGMLALQEIGHRVGRWRAEKVPAAEEAGTAVVADILTTTIRSLDLRYPEVTEEQRKALAEARKQLTDSDE